MQVFSSTFGSWILSRVSSQQTPHPARHTPVPISAAKPRSLTMLKHLLLQPLQPLICSEAVMLSPLLKVYVAACLVVVGVFYPAQLHVSDGRGLSKAPPPPQVQFFFAVAMVSSVQRDFSFWEAFF